MTLTKQRVRVCGLAVLAAALFGFVSTSFATFKHPKHEVDMLPTIFVHGAAGSAAQYQSQAMRFASNGVPDERVLAFEYNSGSVPAIIGAPTALDAMVDEVRARFGVERVNLVGHSLGTFVSGNYLANPTRAAKIAKYIGIDGRSDPTCGVAVATLQCMGIFAGNTGNVGENNVYFNGTQTHVQVATSPESFAAQYEFLTGQPPKTTRIVRDRGFVQIAGRVVDFPANAGANGATLDVWRISSKTGRRLALKGTHAIGADGNFGPVWVHSGKHYELAVRRDRSPQYHFYFQPFPRATHLVRMNLSPAGSTILANTNTGPNHTAAVVVRQKEWWTNHPSGENDVLKVGTFSRSGGIEPLVDILPAVGNNTSIGIHVHDDAATPMLSTLTLLPFFPTQAFQTGVDVLMPAAEPTDGTIAFVNLHHGNTRDPQVIVTRNWSSSGHRVTATFNDYLQ